MSRKDRARRRERRVRSGIDALLADRERAYARDCYMRATWTTLDRERLLVHQMEPRHAFHSYRMLERNVRGYIRSIANSMWSYALTNAAEGRAPMATDAAEQGAEELDTLCIAGTREQQLEWLYEDSTYQALRLRASLYVPPASNRERVGALAEVAF